MLATTYYILKYTNIKKFFLITQTLDILQFFPVFSRLANLWEPHRSS